MLWNPAFFSGTGELVVTGEMLAAKYAEIVLITPGADGAGGYRTPARSR